MKPKQIVKSLLLAALIGSASVAHIAKADEPSNFNEARAYLAGTLKAKYPATEFSQINETPINGLYELITGKNIFYTDKEANYLIMGNMYDMANSRDLTAERREQLNKVDFAALDPANAIVEVKGDGSRQLAILTDVDCPYCRKLEQTLKNVTNVTIHRYLYPIASLHPQAPAISAKIWCQGDNELRHTALMNYMERDMAPANVADCETPLATIQSFAQQHELFGTPSLINGAGNILPGAVPQERLEAFLDSGLQASADAGAAVTVTEEGESAADKS